MKGSVFPRPAKRVVGRDGRERLAPLRAGEEWTDPRTGKTVRAGKTGSAWAWQLTTGTRKRGDRKHHGRSGYATKKAAEEALAEALAALGRGDDRVLVRPTDTPLGDYLSGWLEARRASSTSTLKPTTVAGYADAIRAWVRPHVGHLPVSEVTAKTLLGLYSTLRERGSKCRRCDGKGTLPYQARDGVCPGCDGAGGRPLGDRSVMLVHTLLAMALADAVEAGDLAVDPVQRIPRRQRPTYSQRKQADRHWDHDQARLFLEHTTEDRLYPLWAMALDTGARRGELAALRWTDLDMGEGRVSIERSRVHVDDRVVEGAPKSRAAVRTVDLDPRTVAVLRAWRAVQQQDRLAAGQGWEGGPLERAYLFTDEVGAPYRPDGLSDRFERAQVDVRRRLWGDDDGEVDDEAAEAGLPRIPFHGLRHTSATLALSARPVPVPVHVVQERLGHANISITLGTYSHVLPKQGTDAARVIGGLLYGDAATGTEGAR